MFTYYEGGPFFSEATDEEKRAQIGWAKEACKRNGVAYTPRSPWEKDPT
jgi:hypothetical protein